MIDANKRAQINYLEKLCQQEKNRADTAEALSLAAAKNMRERCIEELQRLRTRHYDIGTVDAAIARIRALPETARDLTAPVKEKLS